MIKGGVIRIMNITLTTRCGKFVHTRFKTMACGPEATSRRIRHFEKRDIAWASISDYVTPTPTSTNSTLRDQQMAAQQSSSHGKRARFKPRGKVATPVGLPVLLQNASTLLLSAIRSSTGEKGSILQSAEKGQNDPRAPANT